jgi:hypothetical protein
MQVQDENSRSPSPVPLCPPLSHLEKRGETIAVPPAPYGVGTIFRGWHHITVLAAPFLLPVVYGEKVPEGRMRGF